MALTLEEKARLLELYEPIIFFHPEERHRLVLPTLLIFLSAMWCNKPPAHAKQSWGNCSHDEKTPFPRTPLIARNAISVSPNDADSDTMTFIGNATDEGFQTYLVNNGERELFLETLPHSTWVASGPATESDLSAEIGEQGGVSGAVGGNYFVDVRDQDSIGDIPRADDTPIPPGWPNAMRALYPRGFWLLTFLFLYHYHEERLTDCEIDSEVVHARRKDEPLARHLHGSYAGEWQAVSVLVPNPGRIKEGAPTGTPPQPMSPLDLPDDEIPQPEFVGFSRRARGVFTNISGNTVENRDYTFMPISSVEAGEVRLRGSHTEVYVSRGTHNNYAGPGDNIAPKFDPSLPFGIEFIDWCMAADNAATLLKKEEELEQQVDEGKRKARVWAIGLGKILSAIIAGAAIGAVAGGAAGAGVGAGLGVIIGAFGGAMAAVGEGLGGGGPDVIPPNFPSGPETVDDVGPQAEFGLILAPQSLREALSSEFSDSAKEVSVAGGGASYDSRIVDRDSFEQLWWQPDGAHPIGYQGRWGVVSERDPFNRRSGTEIPYFEAAFVNALLARQG